MRRGWRWPARLGAAGILAVGAALTAGGPRPAQAAEIPMYLINGLACYGPDSCLAVGGHNTTGPDERILSEAWNGRAWRKLTTPDPTPSGDSSALFSGSCWSASGCLAVGSGGASGQGLEEARGHGKWRLLNPQKRLVGDDVSCPAASDCVVVGYQGSRPLAQTWDRGRWRTLRPVIPRHSVDSEFTEVACATPTRCLAIGDYDVNPDPDPPPSLVEAWNGRSWRILKVPMPPGRLSGAAELLGVGCPPSGPCMVVGTYNTDQWEPGGVQRSYAAVWGTAGLRELSPPSRGPGSNLAAVACGAARDCVALGLGQTAPLAAQWTGSRWRLAKIPGSAKDTYDLIACGTGRTCMAMGWRSVSGNAVQPVLAAAWNGTRWRAVRALNP
jgi:hypothetical protein